MSDYIPNPPDPDDRGSAATIATPTTRPTSRVAARA